MRINKDSLSARVLNIAKEKGISANVVYSRYFFEAKEVTTLTKDLSSQQD